MVMENICVCVCHCDSASSEKQVSLYGHSRLFLGCTMIAMQLFFLFYCQAAQSIWYCDVVTIHCLVRQLVYDT